MRTMIGSVLIVFAGCRSDLMTIKLPLAEKFPPFSDTSNLSFGFISTGAVIEISVKEDTAFNRRYVIPASGKIHYAPIGEMTVAGLPPATLASQIKMGLEKDLFSSATVSVSIVRAVDADVDYVHVVGYVDSPGEYPWKPGLTLGEVVQAARPGPFRWQLALVRCASGQKPKTIITCRNPKSCSKSWLTRLEKGDFIYVDEDECSF